MTGDQSDSDLVDAWVHFDTGVQSRALAVSRLSLGHPVDVLDGVTVDFRHTDLPPGAVAPVGDWSGPENPASLRGPWNALHGRPVPPEAVAWPGDVISIVRVDSVDQTGWHVWLGVKRGARALALNDALEDFEFPFPLRFERLVATPRTTIETLRIELQIMLADAEDQSIADLARQAMETGDRLHMLEWRPDLAVPTEAAELGTAFGFLVASIAAQLHLSRPLEAFKVQKQAHPEGGLETGGKLSASTDAKWRAAALALAVKVRTKHPSWGQKRLANYLAGLNEKHEPRIPNLPQLDRIRTTISDWEKKGLIPRAVTNSKGGAS